MELIPILVELIDGEKFTFNEAYADVKSIGPIIEEKTSEFLDFEESEGESEIREDWDAALKIIWQLAS